MLIGPFCIKTPTKYSKEDKDEIIALGESRSLILKPGDGLIYKGCERPHWRDPMPTPKKKKERHHLEKKAKRILLSSNFLSLCFARWK